MSTTQSQSQSQTQKQTQTGTFTLLLFASASTLAHDTDQLTLPAPQTLRELFRHLDSQYPGYKEKILRSCAVTVNLEYVDFEVEELDRDGTRKGKGDVAEDLESEGEGEGEGLDLVIKPRDEVGIIPPVSSG